MFVLGQAACEVKEGAVGSEKQNQVRFLSFLVFAFFLTYCYEDKN